MPDSTSGSIDDLLSKKETPGAESLAVPEKTSAASVESVPPVLTPETPASPVEVGPKTLAEDIMGKEAEPTIEREQPQARSSNVSDATDAIQDDTAKPSPVINNADLKNIQTLPQDQQVKVLIEMVMTDGLEKALVVIKRLNNPYIYDLLHDTLVDELYQRLKGPKLKQ